MSASALLAIGVLMRSFGRGRFFVLERFRLLAQSALWRQLPAHDRPGADQKGDTDNRRRGQRSEILPHEGYLDPCGQSRFAALDTGIARGPDTTGDVPAIGTLPAATRTSARRPHSRVTSAGRGDQPHRI